MGALLVICLLCIAFGFYAPLIVIPLVIGFVLIVLGILLAVFMRWCWCKLVGKSYVEKG